MSRLARTRPAILAEVRAPGAWTWATCGSAVALSDETGTLARASSPCRRVGPRKDAQAIAALVARARRRRGRGRPALPPRRQRSAPRPRRSWPSPRACGASLRVPVVLAGRAAHLGGGRRAARRGRGEAARPPKARIDQAAAALILSRSTSTSAPRERRATRERRVSALAGAAAPAARPAPALAASSVGLVLRSRPWPSPSSPRARRGGTRRRSPKVAGRCPRRCGSSCRQGASAEAIGTAAARPGPGAPPARLPGARPLARRGSRLKAGEYALSGPALPRGDPGRARARRRRAARD